MISLAFPTGIVINTKDANNDYRSNFRTDKGMIFKTFGAITNNYGGNIRNSITPCIGRQDRVGRGLFFYGIFQRRKGSTVETWQRHSEEEQGSGDGRERIYPISERMINGLSENEGDR